ncbi:glycosyltransferase family 39 protein [Amycolatopsis jejuensis]|uniref:glycosyltransferase family 39 protein n=1 Tax=Amycolatopsis jejuensis TaxID=330084 RepID=UPI00052485D2|nr:glycosyltransferase family 39 protein [Amycolatopsis jejuensis]
MTITQSTDPAVATERRPYLQAAAVYLGIRLFGVVVLAVCSAISGQPLSDRLTAWDGLWYLAIADHGYDGITHGLYDAEGHFAPHTPLAFFPAYPTLMRLLSPWVGGSLPAGLLLSVAAGILAAAAIYRIGRTVTGSHRTGVLLVALWAGAPMAITLSMVYTEALFTALAAWALVGVLERRWLLAALCSIAAGLTRPTASVLVGVVVIAALVAFFKGPRRPQPLVAAVAAPVGLVGYWLWVAVQTGSPSGWFDLEWRGWRTRFDFGAETLEFVGKQLLRGTSVMELLNVFILVLAAVAAVLLARSARADPRRWPLALYGIGVVVLVAGTAGIPFAKARFLLPGFTLLLPVAAGLAARRPATAIAATAGYVAFGAWFGAYSLVGWRYAI